MWGTETNTDRTPRRLRIIPASVGNGDHDPGLQGPRTDHPRECGERHSRSAVPAVLAGSSPRVWGTVPPGCSNLPKSRIIPASVGNGLSSPSSSATRKDHPRECGERVISTEIDMWGLGSSPRVWGTADRAPLPSQCQRIIPASVGNGTASTSSPLVQTDHPRECGERLRKASNHRFRCGSSPRVWGTGGYGARCPGRHRIIPASVGNGGNVLHVLSVSRGSSPRVWGTGSSGARARAR